MCLFFGCSCMHTTVQAASTVQYAQQLRQILVYSSTGEVLLKGTVVEAGRGEAILQKGAVQEDIRASSRNNIEMPPALSRRDFLSCTTDEVDARRT